jgi:hypothetical protein
VPAAEVRMQGYPARYVQRSKADSRRFKPVTVLKPQSLHSPSSTCLVVRAQIVALASAARDFTGFVVVLRSQRGKRHHDRVYRHIGSSGA